MSSTWTWTDFAVFLAGLMLGGLLKWGYLRVQGIRVRVPYIQRSDASFGIALTVISVLSLVTIVQTQANGEQAAEAQVQAEQCAREFRDALAYNASVNNTTRRLDQARDEQQDRARDALEQTFKQIVMNTALPIDQYRTANAQVIEGYQRTSDDVQAKVAKIDADRIDADMRRTPYPDPTCGRDEK